MKTRWLVILACVLVTACSKSDVAEKTPTATPAPAETVATPTPKAKLAIGTLAPEIEHADLDGTTFKLSDYRGKIVLLDFWGDW